MPWTDAVVRAAVSAIATVMPISESAHRALLDLWLEPAAGAGPLRAATALGCALALTVMLRERLGPCVRALGEILRRRGHGARGDGGRDLTVVAVASALSIALQWQLRARAEVLEREPLVVGVGLVATVVTLLSTMAAPPPRRLRPGVPGALAVGLAHGRAVIPGGSQVGAAFVALCWLGIRGWRAAELGLLITLPTLLVAASRALPAAPTATGAALGPMAITLLVAAATTAAAARVWQWVADHDHTRLFVVWTAPLALAMLGYAQALAR